MTRVDFYLLSDATEAAREAFACRLAHKAWRSGLRVLLSTTDQGAAERLDELLWRVPEDTFIPHGIAATTAGSPDSPDSPSIPVAITSVPDYQHFDQLLINLMVDVPPMFSRFERVAEVVPQDATARQQSRERYRYYQHRGYELTHHEIETSTL